MDTVIPIAKILPLLIRVFKRIVIIKTKNTAISFSSTWYACHLVKDHRCLYSYLAKQEELLDWTPFDFFKVNFKMLLIPTLCDAVLFQEFKSPLFASYSKFLSLVLTCIQIYKSIFICISNRDKKGLLISLLTCHSSVKSIYEEHS